MKINTERGKRLKECRVLLGYTQEALGAKAHYKKEAISMYETGARNLSENAANTLAKALNVRANYLLCKDNIIFEEDKAKQNTTNYQKANCFDTLLNFFNYELYGIPETEKEASGISFIDRPMALYKGFVIKNPQNELFYCSNELLDELIDDVMDYAIMRLDKRLIPQCRKPTDQELESARITPEGVYIPSKLTLSLLKTPNTDLRNKLAAIMSEHSFPESKDND